MLVLIRGARKHQTTTQNAEEALLLLARWHQSEDVYLQKKFLWQVDMLGIYRPLCHEVCNLPNVLLLCFIQSMEALEFVHGQPVNTHFELPFKRHQTTS